jgi:4-amino-4-deoxychorismate lyase
MATLPAIVNGQQVCQLDIGDRGLAFGDGVFETIRYNCGQAVLLDLHLQRMADGCSRLQIPWQAEIATSHLDQLEACLAPGDSGVIKLIVSRGQTSRGYLTGDDIVPTYIASWHQLPSANREAEDIGVVLPILDFQLSINPGLAGIKHLNRLEQVLAGQEIQRRGVVEGLLLDRESKLIEALSMNVFLARDSVWHTPQLNNCGVAGTARQHLLQELMPRLGLDCEIRDIHVDELAQYEQAFIVNSVKGLWPIASLAGRKLVIKEDQRNLQRLLMAEIEGAAG